MKKILLAGGTGLIGTHLAQKLTEKGYEVALLSRTPQLAYPTFLWDIPTQKIDIKALEWADAVVNLAGAGVADKSWSKSYKQMILESRTMSCQLFAHALQNLPAEKRPQTFVSASAIGYYGLDTGEAWLQESAPAGDGFLADVTKQWENALLPLMSLGMRVLVWRIGVVLAQEGGALSKMANPVRWGVGSALGLGKQYVSWIHAQDLVRMMIFGLEKADLKGTYNAVAPAPATNEELTTAIAKALGKPKFLPAVPAFVLRLLLGEMADIVLGGNRVSAEKIQQAGFAFDFPTLASALKDLLTKKH